IQVSFERDFQLEWPAGIGGTYISWEPELKAFYLGEESKRYAALVGSPSATDGQPEFYTNYSSSPQSSIRLGVSPAGIDTKVVVIAGSVEGRAEAEKTYHHLANDHASLLQESAKYYSDYLDQTVQLELPDRELQQAYDWSRISMVQGLVSNP